MVQQIIFSDQPVTGAANVEYRQIVDSEFWLTGIYAYNQTSDCTIIVGVNPVPNPAAGLFWQRMPLKQEVLHINERLIWEGNKKVSPGNELFIFFEYCGAADTVSFSFIGDKS